MNLARRKGDKIDFSMLDDGCLGRECFSPGEFQHRGATGAGGSRATGTSSFTCMRRAHHGCPSDRPIDPELVRKRKAQGWTIR